MSRTPYLDLNIPDKSSKGFVVTDVFEPNFTKLDQEAERVNLRKMSTEDNIEELKKADRYKLGDVVEVLGFHAKGDGAHHKRVAKAEDDGSGEQGQNGIWWCVAHSGEVNVSWFGAKGDGVTDDTTAIQKALYGFNNIYGYGKFLISNSIIVQADSSLSFRNSEFIVIGKEDKPIPIFTITDDNIKIEDFSTGNENQKNRSVLSAILINPINKIPKNVTIKNVKSFNSFYCIQSYGVSNLTIEDCYAYRCDDGFSFTCDGALTSNTKHIDVYLKKCIAIESGFNLTVGGKNSGGASGFEFDDSYFENITVEDCVSSGNYGFGYNIHFHDYITVLSDTKVENFKFYNCLSENNNIPEELLEDVVGIGNCSGFGFICDKLSFENITLIDCKIEGHKGYAIFARHINDTFNNDNLIKNLNIEKCTINSSSSYLNSTVRPNNSLFDIRGVEGISFYKNKINVNNSDVLVVYKIISARNYCDIIENIYEINNCNLIDATGLLNAESIICIEGEKHTITKSDNFITIDLFYSEKVKNNEVVNKIQGSTYIKQLNTSSYTNDIKIDKNNVFASTTNLSIFADLSLVGRSKIISNNTIYNSDIGIKGLNSENTIIIGNFFDISVLTKITGLQPSTILSGNYGLTSIVSTLDTPYHASNMQKLGILDSYHNYLTELHEYEKQQNTQSDSEIMNLNVIQPPVIPAKVEVYVKEYNLI